ncbi:MAG TPA: hypothetical protein ENK52_01815, partial [Saprospiraceae bacterium]|nr:hypothetical protein [Saprospiraceae bacterium]
MQPISENRIKRTALQFLKTYYKFRPRKGDTTANYDMKTAGGIIADGYLSFVKPDGKIFTATFEATSKDTIGEIYYTLQRSLMFWDSFAFASLIAAFVASYCYTFNIYTIKTVGVVTSFAALGSVVLGVAFIYFLISRNFSRYRYIYALEQFKRYHADEQWVALAEDAFENPEDKHLLELKHQCVYNGFGLIMVDSEAEPHLHITPARQELFKHKRKSLLFVERIKNDKANKMAENLAGKWDSFKSKFVVQSKENNLLRYSKSYFSQVLLVLVSASLIGGIYYRQFMDTDIVYVDEKKYEAELSELAESAEPEVDEYFLDTPIVASNSVVEKYNGFEDDPPEFEAASSPPVKKTKKVQAKNDIEILVSTNKNGDAQGYDCARFYNFKGTIYMAQDQLYERMENAVARMNLLKQKGISANVLYLGCFSSSLKVYAVYYDLLFPNKQEARDALKKFKTIIK